ncbi:MAG: aquaporin [Holosporales bacterium]|jgi:aquaporin Z|nr:aquaporin [Holosporales bacterium]
MESSFKKSMSEMVGTFLLVFIGCGCAVFSGGQVGWLGVSFAFGLALMVAAYALGPISGCHVNPAVTLALLFSGKTSLKDAIFYIIFQLLGATLAGGCLFLLAKGTSTIDVSVGLALNGYGDFSPTHLGVFPCFLAEFIATSILIFTVIMVTRPNVPAGSAPIALFGVLTTLLILTIPFTNASMNFARSFGVAIFHGKESLIQLWLFAASQASAAIVVPILVKIFFREEK